MVRHFPPHPGRDDVHRIPEAAGPSRRPVPAGPETPAGRSEGHGPGFVHADVKRPPEPRTAGGACRERHPFAAPDRRSRAAHLAVRDDETGAAARAFPEEAVAAFPFRDTRLLTDRGGCLTAGGFEERCRDLGAGRRKTRPYAPRTNGAAERFNGRVQREVLGVTAAGHRDLERSLEGFDRAYDARRQRVPDGRPPDGVVRERLARERGLAGPGCRLPPSPRALPRAMLVIERASDASQPDS